MSQDNVSHFSKYGRGFQEKIFQGLLLDHQWSAQMVEVMTHEYFELKYLQYLCDRFFGFYVKYKNFPQLSIQFSLSNILPSSATKLYTFFAGTATIFPT